MNSKKLSELVVGALLCLMLMAMLAPVSVVTGLVNTVTVTITGYNVADGTHIVNGIWALIFPLFFGDMFVFILRLFNRVGDFFVTLFEFGIAIGSSFGTLTGLIPIAFTIVCWGMVILWWWSGGQGSGASASGDVISLPAGAGG